MVHLIVGSIGGGKSTLLRSIYASSGRGDGVLNRRLLQDGIWTGQEIVQLSTGATVQLSARDGFAPPHWDALWRLGSLTISRRGMSFAKDVVEDIIAHGVQPVYIDEIGPLELSGYGFHQQFIQLVDLGGTVYVAVRESCLSQVMSKYALQKCSLIYVATNAKS